MESRNPSALVTLEDVTRAYPPNPLVHYDPPQYGGPVLAIGRAVYEAQPHAAVDGLIRIIASALKDFAPGNVWLLPTLERMTFPYSVYWPLACAFATEREQQRKFDWYLYIEDDVLCSYDDVMALMRSAKANDAKFMSAIAYDRFPPHAPAVVEKYDGQDWKWVKAPASGSYPVEMVGMCLCLFHRSVFELVAEPWFGVAGPSIGSSGIAPDWWWCGQMRKAGLQPWVCCDTDITHLGMKQQVNRKLSEDTLARQGVPDCAVGGKLTPYTSHRTGALVVKPFYYPDGRIEVSKPALAQDNRAIGSAEMASMSGAALDPKTEQRSADWAGKTLLTLTCQRDKEIFELSMEGRRLFWPGIANANLLDTDTEHETPLPSDVREIVRDVRHLRKVFDLPYMSPTDEIYCIDSGSLVFQEPMEWTVGRALYVGPGDAGREWLQMGNEVWRAIGHKGIDTDMIFCGGCWAASRKAMFKDQREVAIAYVRECAKRGHHKMGLGRSVVMEQCLLNGLFHNIYQPHPLSEERFPLDRPNPKMVIFHVHMLGYKPESWIRSVLNSYRHVLDMKLQGVVPA